MKTVRLSVTLGVMVAALTLRHAGAADEKPLDARQTAQSYIDLAIAGKFGEAAALGEPGQSPSRQKDAKNIQSLGVKTLAITSVHAEDAIALAVTENVPGDHDRVGPLLLTLVKKDGRWMVQDIDLEKEARGKEKLKEFVEKHPNAREIPAAKDPK